MAKITMKYTGGGFLPGIPARDLTASEVKRYGQERLVKSGLYELKTISQAPNRRATTTKKESED